jgi:hypothetical protein
MAEIERHLAVTHSAGSAAPMRPGLYCRIQSPVVFVEFDHHAGGFSPTPSRPNSRPHHAHAQRQRLRIDLLR